MAEGEEAFKNVGELRTGVSFAHVGELTVFVEVEAVVAFNGHAVPIRERVLDFAVLAEHVVAVMQVVAHAAVTAAFTAEVKREFQAYANRPLVFDLVELEVGVRRGARAVVLVAGLDVFVREEFLADIDANLEVDILEDFANAVFQGARHKARLEHFGVLLGIAGIVVVEREELEAEAAEYAQVKVAAKVKGETGEHGRSVSEEPELFVVVRALLVFFTGFFVLEGVLRAIFNRSELNGIDFGTEPKGKRNVRLPKRGNQRRPQETDRGRNREKLGVDTVVEQGLLLICLEVQKRRFTLQVQLGTPVDSFKIGGLRSRS